MTNEEERERVRTENGWGFVREDLERYRVRMSVTVDFRWDASTPQEIREALGQATGVLKQIADTAVLNQLSADGLLPETRRDLFYGDNEKKNKTEILLDTGWKPFSRTQP